MPWLLLGPSILGFPSPSIQKSQVRSYSKPPHSCSIGSTVNWQIHLAHLHKALAFLREHTWHFKSSTLIGSCWFWVLQHQKQETEGNLKVGRFILWSGKGKRDGGSPEMFPCTPSEWNGVEKKSSPQGSPQESSGKRSWDIGPCSATASQLLSHQWRSTAESLLGRPGLFSRPLSNDRSN